MTQESVPTHPKSLTDFCREVVGRHSPKWPPSEGELSEEFIKFFELEPFLGFASLEKLTQSLGIQISDTSLPDELAGCHVCFEGKQLILVSNNRAYELSKDQTVLHELREIIEHVFRELERPTFTDATQESRAEEFATLVQMAASMGVWKPLFDHVLWIKSKWRKVGALVLVGAVMMVGQFSLTMLPLYEDCRLNQK